MTHDQQGNGMEVRPGLLEREVRPMIRTQIQLTEAQARSLKELAGRQGISMAEVIRRAVERVVEEAEQRGKRQRALAILGRYDAGPADVSIRHDDYLAEDYLK